MKNAQRGSTLIVALVMLVVLTLLVLSATRSSTTNLRVVGNMQRQEEVAAAAQQAIEQTISNNFTVAPAAANVAVDINSDGTADYTVAVAKPVCTGSTPLQNTTPNLPPECLSSGVASGQTIFSAAGAPSATGTSWCETQTWEVQASVTDAGSGASSTVHQGVSLKVPTGTGC